MTKLSDIATLGEDFTIHYEGNETIAISFGEKELVIKNNGTDITISTIRIKVEGQK